MDRDLPGTGHEGTADERLIDLTERRAAKASGDWDPIDDVFAEHGTGSVRDGGADVGAEPASGNVAAPPRVGDLVDLIDEMIFVLEEAKTVPLSGNVIVDRGRFLGMLRRLRDELPEDLRAARWMVREREAFIARTNEKAKAIVEQARATARELVSEHHILAEAVEEANLLVERAEGEARRIRLEAEDEAERQLEKLEILFGNLFAQVRKARSELHEARPAEPAPPL